MPISPPLEDDEPWMRTQATVINCKQKWGRERLVDDSILPKYVVTFSYEAADRTYTGTYRAHSVQDFGFTFEILYDPKHPEKNTGGDVPLTSKTKLVARIAGVAIALLLLWLSTR